MMKSDNFVPDREPTIGFVAPLPPVWDGMSVQAERFLAGLAKENVGVILVRTNAAFPKNIEWLDRIRVVRAVARFCLLFRDLFRVAPRVDVLHVFSTCSLSFFLLTVPAVAVGKWHRRKVVIHYHGGAAGGFFKYWGWLARPWLSMADRIIVPSPFLVRIFGSLGFRADIVPNILNLEQFRFRKRGAIRPVFIVTRHFDELKYNHRCVVRAFKEVFSSYPDAELWLAGTGRDRALIEQEIVRQGLSGPVRFLGSVANDDLPNVYGQADIMLNGSNIDNTPVALLEAFAAGLPVVSTRAGGIPDMVDDGRTGLLVPLDDSSAMAKAMLRLLKDSDLCAAISQEARTEVEQNTWDSCRRKLLGIYAELNGRCDRAQEAADLKAVERARQPR